MEDREQLQTWVREGRSIRWIGQQLGLNYNAARDHLERSGVRTLQTERVRAAAEARAAGLHELAGICATHGAVVLQRRSDGSYCCLRCRANAVIEWRRRTKQILVAEAGGACVVCSYDRSLVALQFHHVDPSQKEFGIAARGAGRSLDRLRAEAAKCVLLCANCHAEIEGGVRQLPSGAPQALAPGDPG